MVGRVGDTVSELALETLLEATLFGSGKSLSVKDLSESLGYEEDEISEALTSLQGTIKRRRGCLLYTSPSPRDSVVSRMPSSA